MTIQTIDGYSFTVDDEVGNELSRQSDWKFQGMTAGREFPRPDGTFGFFPVIFAVVKAKYGRKLDKSERIVYLDGDRTNMTSANIELEKRND